MACRDAQEDVESRYAIALMFFQLVGSSALYSIYIAMKLVAKYGKLGEVTVLLKD